MSQLTPYQQAENALIAKAQRQFQRDLGHTGQHYKAEPLNYGPLLTRVYNKSNNKFLYFTHTVDSTPIHADLQPILRAYIVLSQVKPKTKSIQLSTIKILAVHLAQYCERNYLPVAWHHLTEPILEQAEQYYQTNQSQTTAYHAGGNLSRFATFLTLNNLCRHLDYHVATPCPQKANVATLAGQQHGLTKLPSQRALHALAQLYNNTATTQDDQFMLNALAILFATGLRIGELVALPLDCIDERGDVCYLRYYNQKTNGDHEQVTLGLGQSDGDRAMLVKEAVAKIKVLTASARERAKILEANPGRCPIPGYAPDDLIRKSDLCQLLGGIPPQTLNYNQWPDKLVKRTIGIYTYYTIASVESVLQSMLPAQLWTIHLKNNTYQLLSQSLFVIFESFLHIREATNPLICTALTQQQVYGYITPRTTGKGTLFERHNIREENGKFCRVHAHQFRHYIDTCLRKGGMSQELITIYRNRASVAQTQQYDHWDEDDLTQLRDKLSQGIRQGTITGVPSRTYDILPAGERERYLEGVIGNVHVSIYGYCVHDFKATPCPHTGRCLKGCTDFLIEPGNPDQYKAALTFRASTQLALDHMHKQAQQRGVPTPEDWLANYNQILAGCNRIVAAHESAIARKNVILPDDITVTTQRS